LPAGKTQRAAGKGAPTKPGKEVALRATTPPPFESKGKDESKGKNGSRATAPPPFDARAKDRAKNEGKSDNKNEGKAGRAEGKPSVASKPAAKKK